MRNLTEGEIVPGRVIGVTSNSVIVDVGYKSEGLIPIEEFTDLLKVLISGGFLLLASTDGGEGAASV